MEFSLASKTGDAVGHYGIETVHASVERSQKRRTAGQVAVPPLPEHDLGVSSNSLERMLQPRAAARLLEMVGVPSLLRCLNSGRSSFR